MVWSLDSLRHMYLENSTSQEFVVHYFGLSFNKESRCGDFVCEFPFTCILLLFLGAKLYVIYYYVCFILLFIFM
jgi:hypothetical protein